MYASTILIKNGRIWDGYRFFYGDVVLNERGIVSVGNSDGVEPNVTFDAGGDIIAPGLVDVHTHLRYLASSTYEINGEAVCFPNGVTAAADAGTKTANAYCDYTSLKLRLFLHTRIRDGIADLSETERLLRYHKNRVEGLKVYFDRTMIGECDTKPLKEVCKYAHERGLKVMVHCANSPVPMAEMLSCLSAGDICTHIYHGGEYTVAEDNFACLKEAKSRGIILDAGLAGNVHTDFEIAEATLKDGILPDTISTDITSSSAFKRGGKYGMTYAMSMMRKFGMAEEDILRAVTSSAAKAIGLEGSCGVLEPGRPSDITILRFTDSKMDITDKKGHTLQSDKGYVCMLTVCNGYVVYRSDLF